MQNQAVASREKFPHLRWSTTRTVKPFMKDAKRACNQTHVLMTTRGKVREAYQANKPQSAAAKCHCTKPIQKKPSISYTKMTSEHTVERHVCSKGMDQIMHMHACHTATAKSGQQD